MGAPVAHAACSTRSTSASAPAARLFRGFVQRIAAMERLLSVLGVRVLELTRTHGEDRFSAPRCTCGVERWALAEVYRSVPRRIQEAEGATGSIAQVAVFPSMIARPLPHRANKPSSGAVAAPYPS